MILDRLSDKVFNKDMLPSIIEKYNDFALSKNSTFLTMQKELQAKIDEMDKGINNIVNIIVSTGSAALTDKLKELESTKTQLQESLSEAERKLSEMHIDANKLKSAFNKAKRMLKDGTLKNPNTEEDLYEGLKSSCYGKCAFKCGVNENKNVVDHQMVQMKFQNGVVATLKMLFCAEPGRRINIFGTHGEIILDEIPRTIEVKQYGQDVEVIKMSELDKDAGYGHGGGDKGIVNDLYSVLIGEKQDYTSLTESLESHLIGVKAEESRLGGGKTLKIHEKV